MSKIREKQIMVLDDFLMGTYGNENFVKYVKDPLDPQDAATKAYVDAKIQGLDPKYAVRSATTPAIGDITLSGEQTIEIALVAGNRVLIKDQDDAEENGIYIVSAGPWSRSDDANTWDKLVSAFVFVEDGAINADTGWVCTIDPGGTLEVDDVEWTQFSGAGSYTADGQGLELGGTQFYIELDGDSMSKSSSGLKAGTHFREEGSISIPTSSPAVDHDTGLNISNTPAGNCDVTIFINGVEEVLSYGVKTGVFYFSADAGVTAKAKADIVSSDSLYFSPANADYNLEVTDKITMIYSKIN